MKHFNITGNGAAYDVGVEELAEGAAPAARPAAPAPATAAAAVSLPNFLFMSRYRLSDPAASAGRIHFDGLILLPAKHFFYLQSGPDDQKLIIGPGL